MKLYFSYSQMIKIQREHGSIIKEFVDTELTFLNIEPFLKEAFIKIDEAESLAILEENLKQFSKNEGLKDFIH